MVQVAEVAELPDQFGALHGRADRVVQGDHAATAAGVHEESVVALMEEQGLVAGQGQAAIRLVRVADDPRRALQLFRVRLADRRRCRAQQPAKGQGQEQQATAEGGAQGARGVGVQGELPPELVAVMHVLVGEQQQPDRGADHADAGAYVKRREGYFHQPAGTVEGAAEHGEQRGGQAQQAGFFPVEAFQQRKQGAHQQQHQGQGPGGRQPSAQTLREQQAEHADQAGDQVRGIDQAMWNEEAEVLQAGVDRRRGAGKQQHDTGEEDQDRQDRCGETRGDADRLARHPQPARFEEQQQQAGQQQRQYHINQAVQEQGRGQRRGAQLAGERGQQHRLEHPDSARYVAEYAGGQGEQVDQQERREGWGFRQQQIKDGSGGGDVEGGDQQLQQRQAQARQAQAAAAEADQQAVGGRPFSRQAVPGQERHQADSQQQDGDRDDGDQGVGQVQRRCRIVEVAECGECRQHRQCAAQGKAGK